PTPAWGLRVGGIGCLLSSGHLCVHDYLSDLLPVIADSFDNSRDQFIERLDVIFGKGNFLRVLQDAQWIAKIWREPEPLCRLAVSGVYVVDVLAKLSNALRYDVSFTLINRSGKGVGIAYRSVFYLD